MIRKTNYEYIRGYTKQYESQNSYKTTFGELGSDPTYEDVFKAASSFFKGQSDTELYSNVNLFFHLHHMKLSGEKIYHISSGLSARLAQTDVNVDSYFIKSPFREIYIQIEPGLFFMKDHYSQVIPVTGFYVYLRDFGDVKKLRVLANGLSKTPTGDQFNAVYYIRMELKPGKVQEQVKDYITEHLKTNMEDVIRFGGLQNIDYWDEFIFFVMNSLLYITSKNPDFSNYVPVDFQKQLDGLKNPAKKRKLEQRMSKVSKYPIIVVGAGITDKHTQDIQNAGGIGAWKLKSRVRVSGHWRVQWYGSEKDNTRKAETIWINDYEKGPELAEMLKTPYIVK